LAKISYSTAGFKDRDIAGALRGIAAAGFVSVETSSQPAHVSSLFSGDELETFRTLLKDCGLGVGTVHAPMRENVLGAPEESWRREKMDVMTEYLHFAAVIEAKGMVIHPVPNPIFVPNPERSELCRSSRMRHDALSMNWCLWRRRWVCACCWRTYPTTAFTPSFT
jgi:sugar phosphate isomerase/epimerase